MGWGLHCVRLTFRCGGLLGAGGGVEQAAGVGLMFWGFDNSRHEDLMSSLGRRGRSHMFLGFEMSRCIPINK